MESDVPTKRDEYAVLVPSTPDEIFALAQLYRNRAEAEHNFDELKNQWGWGGFTTQDLARLHAKQSATQAVLTNLAGLLNARKATAEPWTNVERLRAILTRAFAKCMLPTAGPPALPISETAAT